MLLSGSRSQFIANHGAAGPSGVDAYAWQQICASFGDADASASLYDALASVAHCLSTITFDSVVLMPFTACRLIPLDRCPELASNFNS